MGKRNADRKISGSTAALVGKRQMDARIEKSAHDLYVDGTLCLMRIPPAEDIFHRCAHLSSIWDTHADTDGPFCLYSPLAEYTFLHKRKKKGRRIQTACASWFVITWRHGTRGTDKRNRTDGQISDETK